MSSTRLFILGSLVRLGPMHGHQIRRYAEEDRTHRWTEITIGSLYGALKRLAKDGSIEVYATEQDGNLPTRTIYAITDRGAEELAQHRAEALRDFHLAPDVVDLALQYSDDIPDAELREVVAERRALIHERLESWEDLIEHASPYLKGLEATIIRHPLLRLEAELRWHDEVLAHLDSNNDPR